MGKYHYGLVTASLMFAASFATPAFSQDAEERSADAPEITISNTDECDAEGGSMVPIKGGEYCLVPIRPEEYRAEVYDGNQLGIIECPGDTVNDELYCLYPVNVPEEDASEDDAKAAESEDSDADSAKNSDEEE